MSFAGEGFAGDAGGAGAEPIDDELPETEPYEGPVEYLGPDGAWWGLVERREDSLYTPRGVQIDTLRIGTAPAPDEHCNALTEQLEPCRNPSIEEYGGRCWIDSHQDG